MRIPSLILRVSLLVAPLLLTACAGRLGPVVIDGVPTPRITQEFSGRPYAIRHTDAYPKALSPSSGVQTPGGTIAGTVCGADINFEVSHKSDHIRVSGFINNMYSVALEVREANHIRRIQGGLGNFAVDVLVADDLLAGAVGRNHYELHRASADLFSQTFRSRGYEVQMRIDGHQALMQLPAADQAALVPLVLACAAAKLFENIGHDPPELGFGGPMGAQPPQTIRFGS